MTVTFTGQSSELTANFSTELELDERFEYSCGLLNFTTYLSIPNIHSGNNRLYVAKKIDDKFTKHFFLTIPVGSYELQDLADYIERRLKQEDITFKLIVNKNTLKTTITCSAELHFEAKDSIHQIFGFLDGKIIEANIETQSDDIVKITTLNTINIECDIVRGSYRNGENCHSLYEFTPEVGVGYKIVEVPKHIVYLPITTKRIRSIQLKIVDQNRKPIDFRGEEITCRIHIKRE